MGSCFADSIGELLLENKFKAVVNPAGVIYNPISIHQLLVRALRNTTPAEDSFTERDGRWYCFDVHSSISAETKEDLKVKLGFLYDQIREALQSSRFLMLTYGTGWVYRRIDNGALVANCQKVPGSQFNRELLSVEDVAASFRETLTWCRSVNSGLQVILTLSPVRHLADTAELNQVGKSVLRMACHELASASGRPDGVHYFPAYELMMDDLRDYRFYAEDMIHPSVSAIRYIWEVFSAAGFSTETMELNQHWQTIKKAISHRPFHPESPAHHKFLLRLKSDLEAIREKLDVEDEIIEVESRLVRFGA